MKPRKITCNSNKEWREERSHSVGASAIGTILGLNRYESPMRLAAKMRAELLGTFDFTQNLAMMRGHAYEGGVARLFEQFDKRVEIIEASSAEYIVVRDDMPWLHVSPDRMFWLDRCGAKHGEVSESNKGVLECKTTQSVVNTRRFNQCWYLQLQTELGVCCKQTGVIAWDVLTSKEGFGYRYFEADPEVFGAIAAVAKDFWERVVIGGDDPAPARTIKRRYPMLYKELSFDRVKLQLPTIMTDATPMVENLEPVAESASAASNGTDKQSISLPDPEQKDDAEDTGWLERIFSIHRKF